MSAERFLDDLARMLVTPMPRRRAVRLLGATIAASAVPALRPRPARAQTGICTATTCGVDERCCQKGAEKNFATYCCPDPSWQWLCGAQSNGYRCVNRCVGQSEPDARGRKGELFPCTALIAHPESGINGLCCNRRDHSGCVRIGPEKARAPDGKIVSLRWQPSCCPKGPGFGFCGGTCCQAPNRCKKGLCRCPNGTLSCDGRKCCSRGETCSFCIQTSTAVSTSPSDPTSDVVGRKCCPGNAPYCCGTTCCKKLGCCGTTCCAEPAQCAKAGRAKVCCPPERVVTVAGHRVCCPVGTTRVFDTNTCCPPGEEGCCGGPDVPVVRCGTKVCVRGACVNP